jgi:deazaflavin-dependent oxidoreductase (nitroreductase family)
MDVATVLVAIAGRQYCHLTTTGRRTGRPHTIETWFAAVDDRLYLISGGGDRSDWVRNLQGNGCASVRIGDHKLHVVGHAPLAATAERARAVTALHAKYRSQVSGAEHDWQRDAFIVALDPDRSSA